MIALEGVSARRAPLALANVTLAFGPGVHSIIGGSEDGGPLLLALIAGAARVRGGRVRVADGAPTDVETRRQVARVTLDPALPDGLLVREVLRVAERIRGEPPREPAARLAPLGIQALADRPVRSLSRAEARAVALAEGITSARVRVLVVEEPLIAVDPRVAGRIPEALRAKGREGGAVVVATGSLRDAWELAEDHVLLRRGTVLGRSTSLERLLGFSPEGVHLHVVLGNASAAKSLAGALARSDQVDRLDQDGPCVRARGRDPVDLARAVASAVLQAEVEVVELRLGAPLLEEARAAVQGIATATIDGAQARARVGLESVPPPAREAGP